MALVKFVAGTASNFALLEAKDPDTLYFVTDEQRIYKGDKCFSGGVYEAVAALPDAGSAKLNTLYINTTDGSVSYYNGKAFQQVVKPYTTTIRDSGSDNNALVTEKAVADYIAEKVGDLDVGALAGRVTTLEGEMDAAQAAITTIQGAGEGSINKALSDAKAYADSLAPNYAAAVHTHTLANITDAGTLAGKDQVAEGDLEAGLASKINGKADKATTLDGYGITDAYTTTQTDSKIAEAIAAAPHLKREIVEELPAVGSADANTIYMVPADGSISDPGEQTSHYNEYMFINGAFELIGTSQVDLTGYATETFVTNAINALDVTDTAVTNQYVSQVVQTDGKIAVTRATLPVYSVTAGSAQGTIAVNGSNVAVNGLGSAAYANTGDFDASGAAASAQSAAQTYADGLIAALDVNDSAVSGQYVSAVSEVNGKIQVTRANLPTAPEITEGSTNGTISVGGEDVAVHGLGSAAYTESSAYDAAGSATQALNNAKQYTDTALTWGTI